MTDSQSHAQQMRTRHCLLVNLSRCLLLGLLTTGLAACGGGGGSDGGDGATAPAAPALSLSPQSIKTFSFDWTDISGATEYRLLESPNGTSGFNQVATITSDTTSYDLEAFLPGRINASYILEACNSNGCNQSATVFVSGTLAEAAGNIQGSNTDPNDQFGFRVALSADGKTLAVGAVEEDSNATGTCAPGAACTSDQNDNSAENSGAVYVFTHSNGDWAQQAYFKASNTEADDNFGDSVALSADGNTLAVGADNEDSNAIVTPDNNDAFNSGAAYVFTRSADTWSQQAYIKASNPERGDGFGGSVALGADGNTLAVGASGEDSNAVGTCAPGTECTNDQDNNSAAKSGAVYVFTRDDSNWSQQSYIKASNTEADDLFGGNVALAGDGNTLAVGATREDSDTTGVNPQENNDGFNSGAIYVYVRGGTSWEQQAFIKASNSGGTDSFGNSVALAADGNTMAVGAVQEKSNATGIGGDQSDDSILSSGAVYVFTRSVTSWSQQAYVKASNTGEFDRFGASVALASDGNTLAVGARGEDSDATGVNGPDNDNDSSNGATYVFTRSGDTWSHQAYVKASDVGDRFGISVTLAGDGNTLVVGSDGEDSNTVYLY